MNTYPRYEKIGGDVIRRNANAPLDIYQSGYFFEENVRMDFFIGTIYITDLTNAMKSGKECTQRVFVRDDWTGNFIDMYCDLTNQGLKNFSDVINAEEIEGYSRSNRSEKSIRTFSPFAPVKPIKTPKKWTVALMAKAILSGQIFHGVTEQHLTDDYALDAAENFGKGAAVDLIYMAKNFIEEKSGGIHISPTEKEDGILELSVSTYSYDYKNYFFDKNCNWDIKKNRLEQMAEDLEEANQQALAQVIEVSPHEISDEFIYRVSTLEADRNTCSFKEKTQMMYPETLRRSAEIGYDIIEIEEESVEISALYQIANLQNKISSADIKDFRFISVGGGSIVVTGFALLELLQERKRFPVLRKLFLSFDAQKIELQKIADGSYWHFSDLENTKFSPIDSIVQLIQEELRISNERR